MCPQGGQCPKINTEMALRTSCIGGVPRRERAAGQVPVEQPRPWHSLSSSLQRGWEEQRGLLGAARPAHLQATDLCSHSEEQKENRDTHSDTLTCTQQNTGRERDWDSASVWQLTLGFDPPQSGYLWAEK